MTAVLFDMDGVVIDSETYWKRHQAEDLLPKLVPDEEVVPEEITGMFYKEIADYLEETYGMAVSREDAIELFEQTGRQIYSEEAEVVDGVPELITELRERGVSVSLVTSSPYHWIDLVLERLELTDAFDAVVSGADVEDGKPAPDIFERAARQAGEDPSDCIAIEDSTNGAAAAKAAGAFTIGFTGVHDEMDHSIPDVVARNPEELRERILERL
ncbi:MAG: HAD family hydrolase [archaeon]